MTDQQRGLLLLALGIIMMASLSWVLSKDRQQAMRTAKYIVVHHCRQSGGIVGRDGAVQLLYQCTTGTFTKDEIAREANDEYSPT